MTESSIEGLKLPFRIQYEGGHEAVLSIDGGFGAPGLELSHWPGNRTPPELKRDLSTGIALAFARLPAAERARLTEGLVAIANNHIDTDGICTLFALTTPRLALQHERALLATAEAGDRFRTPTDAAFVLDQIITALADSKRSPWRERWGTLDTRSQDEQVTLECVKQLPAWLEGDIESLRELWQPALTRLQTDRSDLEAAHRDDLVHLSSIIWTAGEDVHSSAPGAECFDPGRHALFGKTLADRVMVLGPGSRGTTCRLVIGTGSFFDLVDEKVPPRPSLTQLASKLNQLEACAAGAPLRWRHDVDDHASPELWFGAEKLSSFPEHAASYLRPSSLDFLAIKSVVLDSLRAAFVISDDEAEAENADWLDV